MKKTMILMISLFFLSGCNSVPEYQDPDNVNYTIESEYEVDEETKKGVQVIEDNLKYAQEENMENYLSTLVKSAHEETEEELKPFFETYDIDHTILSVEVLDQEADTMLVRTEQQTVMIDSVDGADSYRDHVTEANHTLVKEKGGWKIQETIMTDTTFLDYSD